TQDTAMPRLDRGISRSSREIVWSSRTVTTRNHRQAVARAMAPTRMTGDVPAVATASIEGDSRLRGNDAGWGSTLLGSGAALRRISSPRLVSHQMRRIGGRAGLAHAD